MHHPWVSVPFLCSSSHCLFHLPTVCSFGGGGRVLPLIIVIVAIFLSFSALSHQVVLVLVLFTLVVALIVLTKACIPFGQGGGWHYVWQAIVKLKQCNLEKVTFVSLVKEKETENLPVI